MLGRRTRARNVLRTLLVWSVGLGICLALLAGRYDWSPEYYASALRGYLTSAYMLVVTLPTIYYLVAALVGRADVARAATVAAAIVCALPYRWLGLDRWYYYRHRVAFWSQDAPGLPKPHADWLPRALGDLRSIPHEVEFFTTLAGLGVLIAVAVAWWPGRAMPAGDPNARRCRWAVAGWLGLYLLILLETWLHLSMRSPYMYLTHFEKPEAAGYWYLVYLFPHARGAVNADYPLFRALEEIFLGTPGPVNTMLVRRSYPFYLSGQFTYFFSAYCVFLVFNVLLWFAACAATYRFARAAWNPQVARGAAFLVACGSGFIMYVAQPMSYLPGFALIAILACLFELLVAGRTDHKPGEFLLFGAVLGIGAMVYDIFSFYVFLLGYAWLRRVALAGLLVSFLVSLVIYAGFQELVWRVLRLEAVPGNAEYIAHCYHNIVALLAEPRFGTLYVATVSLMRAWLGHLGNVFLVLPLALALLGLPFAREQGSAAVPVLLLLPSLFSLAFLHFGAIPTSYYGSLNPDPAQEPRFVYVAYPAVYALAAIALTALRRGLVRRGWVRLGHVTPLVVLAAVFVLNNLDVFGYPQLYYLFYYESGGHFGDH